jgi:hypothetical protein
MGMNRLAPSLGSRPQFFLSHGRDPLARFLPALREEEPSPSLHGLKIHSTANRRREKVEVENEWLTRQSISYN